MAALSAAAIADDAPPVRVIFSSIPGDRTSVVPGVDGATFVGFSHPYLSPDGGRWVVRASTTPFGTGPVLLLGSGASGRVLLARGDPAPWAPGQTVEAIEPRAGVDDAGHVAIGVNTSGPTDADEYIVRYDDPGYSLVAREGDPIPILAGAAYGPILDEAQVVADGIVCFRTVNAYGLEPDQNALLIGGGAVVARQGVTVPTGQASGAAEPWENFAIDGFFCSGTPGRYMATGDLAGDISTDGVVTIGGGVVIQEGSPIPGLPGLVSTGLSGIRAAAMTEGGHWIVRGSNSDGTDWVIRDGVVVAATGDELFPGAEEFYSDDAEPATFLFAATNDAGDTAVGAGTTSGAAVVRVGGKVLARVGDPVDVDGDGTAQDGVYLAQLRADKASLTDSGLLYFVARLADADGADLGDALLVLGNPCPCDVDGSPGVDVFDLLRYLQLWFAQDPGAEQTGDSPASIDVFDLLRFLSCWFASYAGAPCP